MKKKAQNAGQIFMYIVAIVVVAVILIVGYNSISQFKTSADKVSILKFQKELETSITRISNEYGRIDNKQFALSDDYKEVCFINNYNFDTTGKDLDQVFLGYPIIRDSIVGGKPLNNIFMVTNENRIAQKYTMGNISLQDKLFDCFKVSDSNVKLKMEGRGNHIVIK